jgi:deazaflavin-dependent oxidoreductase (nitroreductase family)
MNATATAGRRKARRPLLGLRDRPGRLALAFMHMPLRAYAHGQGHLLGHTFLQFTHVGRTSGKEYRAVAMVLGFDGATGEAVICSAWDTDWYRNLRARAATNVTIDRKSYVPAQRFLDEQEAFRVVENFRAAHPHRLRFATRILGWGDFTDDETVREFVRSHPFLAFRPPPAPEPGS